MGVNHRLLGSTGMEVSLISLGTVKLGRNSDVKYPSAFELPSDNDARALLDAARALGVNLLDTAPAYGSSESRLGALLEGQRDEWLICTKAGEIYEGGQSRYDFTEQHIRASVDASLKRLRTDRVDIVLLHSDGRDEEIIEQFGALETLKSVRAQGKARAIGMSAKSASGLRSAMKHGADVLMATLNTDYLEEREAIAEAGASGVGVLVKKALASGHAGPGGLAFVADQPGVSSIVTGTISPEHLAANCRAVS